MTLPAAPACSCGTTGTAHRHDCAFARWAVANSGKRAEGPPPDGLGRRRRHRATRTEQRGIVFASRFEAAVFARLCYRRDAVKGAALLRQAHFDLWSAWHPGMGKPLVFTPDFLLLLPRSADALEPEALDDDVGARAGGHWVERMLDLAQVEVHEAKAPRKLESRDYVVRLAAFRALHPFLPVFVWRSDRGALTPQRLADLEEV